MASGVMISRSISAFQRCLSQPLCKYTRSECMLKRNYCIPYVFRRKKCITTQPMGECSNDRWSAPGLACSSSRRYTAVPDTDIDPHQLIKSDLNTLFSDINKALIGAPPELESISQYHFDGHGKAFRPMLVMLMSKACNQHANQPTSQLQPSQRSIAMIAEMIHTASLVHDDVIDASSTRRGKPSAHHKWGQRKAILAGDYILSVSSIILARIRNEEVVEVLAQVLDQLVSGEFMQLGSKEDETERFNHYIKKTYKKTASLIANSCKAVAILSECSDEAIEAAFQYGRNIGIAFQLVDDLLDFTSSDTVMGKPTTADLKLGLATAPVLFAAHEFPELHAMIMRRFKEPGDVEKARSLVIKSEGVSHTRYLAERHAAEAVKNILSFHSSPERDALAKLTNTVLHRSK